MNGSPEEMTGGFLPERLRWRLRQVFCVLIPRVFGGLTVEAWAESSQGKCLRFQTSCENLAVNKDDSTERLLDLAESGDLSVVDGLLDRHRNRLRQMVKYRMDPRLSTRVDPSDVVQESLAEAAEQLSEYLKHRPLPFYPWLRQIAWRKLIRFHEHHLWTAKRSLKRERDLRMRLSDHSSIQLMQQLAGSVGGPSTAMIRQEHSELVREALRQLSPQQREVLILRYVEQLSVAEIAAILDISPAAVSMRHVRGIERMRDALRGQIEEPE